MSKLPSVLPIQPFSSQPGNHTIHLPGSKSISNRALLLAALTSQTITLQGVLFSRDTEIMIEALTRLGFQLKIDRAGKEISIEGLGGRIPAAKAELDIGNAGTAARFLTAFLSLHPNGEYHLDGDVAMRRRPMRGLVEALSNQGTRFTYHQQSHHFPFTMQTSGFTGGALPVNAEESSQILSALLMIAPFARHPVTLHLEQAVRPSYIRLTMAMMRAFGQPIADWHNQDPTVSMPHKTPYHLEQPHYMIEPDASAASYFLALPLASGHTVTIPRLSNDSLQGDVAFARVLEEVGVAVTRNDNEWIAARGTIPASTTPRKWNFHHFSDTFLTLAALSPLFPWSTTMTGIAHTRLQECDRIEAMAEGLRKLGQTVETTPDSITIHPNYQAMHEVSRNAPVEIATHEDHRVAMSFGILGTHRLHQDKPWLSIQDPACCGKTFPDFFAVLESCQKQSPA